MFLADYYRTKCDEKDEEIVQWRTKAKQLEEQLAEKDSRVSQIQKRLKRQEYKHMEELKVKTDVLHKLQADLLSKSEEVTMMQLTSRSTKTSTDSSVDFSERRRKSATVPSLSGSSPRSSQDSPRTHHHHYRGRRLSTDSAASLSSISSSDAGSSTSIANLKPHPPPPPPSTSTSNTNKPTRRSFNTVINRPASGRKLSTDETAMSAESRAEILEITKSQKERLQINGGNAAGASKLLPPIPPKGPPPPPRLHKANSAAFARRKPLSTDSTGSSGGTKDQQVEVETLAVDQVNGTASKINLRHAQEFNSQDM